MTWQERVGAGRGDKGREEWNGKSSLSTCRSDGERESVDCQSLIGFCPNHSPFFDKVCTSQHWHWSVGDCTFLQQDDIEKTWTCWAWATWSWLRMLVIQTRQSRIWIPALLPTSCGPRFWEKWLFSQCHFLLFKGRISFQQGYEQGSVKVLMKVQE